MNPTPEQLASIEAICAAVQSGQGILMSAVAGGAKTTTLKLSTKEMDARKITTPTLAIAFNKRNALDLEKAMPSWVICKTFNALGHAAWGRTCGKKLTLDTGKIGNIVTALTRGTPLGEKWTDILQLANQARTNLLIHKDWAGSKSYGARESEELWEECFYDADIEPNEDVLQAARAVLAESCRQAYQGLIDFGDQIYMSVCFGGSFHKFPCVLVDEAQDLSEANHRMLELCVSKTLIAVGDRCQGIYAFRGAHSDSMDRLKKRFNLTETHLNTTFRCSKEVTKLARSRNPHMVPFPSNPEGKVTFSNDKEWGLADIPTHCAIICRNTAPLLSLAFKIIRRGRGVQFLGGDLSKGLNKILTSCGPDGLDQSLAKDALALWKSREATKAVADGKDKLLARIEDKYECCLAALENAPTIGEAKGWLTRIFSAESGTIILCTGHKSKGFEWDDVIFLDSWRIPSSYARRAEEAGDRSQMEQELNLRYVIQTRAARNLHHFVTEKFV